MVFELKFTDEARKNLKDLENDNSQSEHLKAVRKCLGYIETNLRHPSLKTHKMKQLRGPNNEEVLEAYAENRRPEAYRIFW